MHDLFNYPCHVRNSRVRSSDAVGVKNAVYKVLTLAPREIVLSFGVEVLAESPGGTVALLVDRYPVDSLKLIDLNGRSINTGYLNELQSDGVGETSDVYVQFEGLNEFRNDVVDVNVFFVVADLTVGAKVEE